MDAARKPFRRHPLALGIITLLAGANASAFDSPAISCEGFASTDLCTISIAPAGGAAIRLGTERGNIQPTLDGSGYRIQGDTLVLSPVGDIPMLAAELVVEYRDASNPYSGLVTLRGSAELPFPQPSVGGGNSGIGGDIGLVSNARAEVGLELGSRLESLGAHLNPYRDCDGRTVRDADFQECPYLFFHIEAGSELAGNLGSDDLQWSLGAGLGLGSVSGTFVLDPFDPYFYLGASGAMPLQSVDLSINPDPEADAAGGEDFGFGFSRRSLIPFAPQTTYGIEQFVATYGADFTGQLVVDYKLPVGTLPLEVDGHTVFRFPVDLDGGVTFSPEFETGSNGDVDVGLPFFDELFSLNFPLGNATVGARFNAREQLAYFSGIAALDAMDFLPGVLPLTATTDAKIYGLLMNRSDASSAVPYLDLGESYAAIESRWLLDLSFGGRQGGFSSGVAADGLLRLSAADGMTLKGRLESGADGSRVHPMIALGGSVSVEMQVDPFTPGQSHYLIRGDISVGGSALGSDAELYISPLESYAAFGLGIDRNAINSAIADASQALSTAQAEVDRLNLAIVQARELVQAERDAHAAALQDARVALSTAQDRVDSLQSAINYQYSRISARNAEIGSWYRWYKSQPWYKKSWAWARYTYERGWRKTEIAGRYVTIGSLEVSKTVAKLALDAAKITLAGLEMGINLTPIDLDPRVSTLILARESATFTLQSLKAALGAVPEMPGSVYARGYAIVNGSGVRGEVRGRYCDDRGCTSFTAGSIDFARREACTEIPGVVEVPICVKF